MVIDKEYLADLVSRLLPEEAASTAALIAASAYAAAAFDGFVPELSARTDGLAPPAVRKAAITKEACRFLRDTRNQWLKEHGAYNRAG